MHVDELKRICEAFVDSVGRKFDDEEFNRVTKNNEFYTFPLMLEFIERRYGANVEEGGAKEAVQDLYDTYALDVLKKVGVAPPPTLRCFFLTVGNFKRSFYG
jgi:hypothetical protein